MEENKVSNNKNIWIGLVSLVVIVLIGFFAYKNMATANADDICILNIKDIEKETVTSNCTNGSWGPWEADPEDSTKEKRVYTGNLTTTEFVLEKERAATKEETDQEIKKSNDGYDEKHYNYVIDEQEMNGYVCNADHDLGGEHHDDLVSNGWSKGEHIDAKEGRDKSKGEARSQDGFVYRKTITKEKTVTGLEGKAGVKNKKTVTDIACQIVQRRTKGEKCDTTFYPDSKDVCEGKEFTQSNACGDTRNVKGEKKDCDETCEDTSWTPDPSTRCEIDGQFVQTSNCGNVRMAEGTKTGDECGELIVNKCKDSNGNMVAGNDSNGDGYCDNNGGGEGDELTLEMSCSLDGRGWIPCESRIWRLKSKNVPIKVKMNTTEGKCNSDVYPAYTDSLAEDVSFNFVNTKKNNDNFVTDAKLTGKIPDEIFEKKIKATYCGDNSVEKTLKIKVLNIKIKEK